jgi:hypothetical protein
MACERCDLFIVREKTVFVVSFLWTNKEGLCFVELSETCCCEFCETRAHVSSWENETWELLFRIWLSSVLLSEGSRFWLGKG